MNASIKFILFMVQQNFVFSPIFIIAQNHDFSMKKPKKIKVFVEIRTASYKQFEMFGFKQTFRPFHTLVF